MRYKVTFQDKTSVIVDASSSNDAEAQAQQREKKEVKSVERTDKPLDQPHHGTSTLSHPWAERDYKP